MSLLPSTIVIVDDDASVCQATQRLLAAAGFGTRTFSSAEELLDSDAAQDAACLVLDVHLPGLTGFELARQLEKQCSTKLPVIFITAQDEPGNAIEAVKLGALAYLRKPFAGTELLSAVHRVARPGPGALAWRKEE